MNVMTTEEMNACACALPGECGGAPLVLPELSTPVAYPCGCGTDFSKDATYGLTHVDFGKWKTWAVIAAAVLIIRRL